MILLLQRRGRLKLLLAHLHIVHDNNPRCDRCSFAHAGQGALSTKLCHKRKVKEVLNKFSRTRFAHKYVCVTPGSSFLILRYVQCEC